MAACEERSGSIPEEHLKKLPATGAWLLCGGQIDGSSVPVYGVMPPAAEPPG